MTTTTTSKFQMRTKNLHSGSEFVVKDVYRHGIGMYVGSFPELVMAMVGHGLMNRCILQMLA